MAAGSDRDASSEIEISLAAFRHEPNALATFETQRGASKGVEKRGFGHGDITPRRLAGLSARNQNAALRAAQALSAFSPCLSIKQGPFPGRRGALCHPQECDKNDSLSEQVGENREIDSWRFRRLLPRSQPHTRLIFNY
jgi:hypothetical protein